MPGGDPLSRLHPDPAGHLERESCQTQKCGLCVNIKRRENFGLDTESATWDSEKNKKIFMAIF